MAFSQLFIIVCIFCVYILAMAWLLNSFCPIPRTRGLTPRRCSVGIFTHDGLKTKLAYLDRGAPRHTFRTCRGRGFKPTEQTPLNDSAEPSCPICLDPVRADDLVHSLPCYHIFHDSCLEYWYLYNNNNCPLCQGPILNESNVASEEAFLV
ncbi:uncharacterized protein BJX67DRAFT_224649 [Aspergillus lucknowensis]|uniref:RING-type domain-containing protein n=1 Tax=Aspergillus lucknowensis TaxID=176173 RepID=A0ABR4LI61_9EURO